VAGAGTGKTAVIAERYRRLVRRGEDPGRILVLTFTERAASEMIERIRARSGLDNPPNVGTFHALALAWLRQEFKHSGLNPGFQILRGPDRWIFMRELMWELADPGLAADERPDDQVAPILRFQERMKQELIPLGALSAWAARIVDVDRRRRYEAVAHLLRVHAERTRRRGLLDFDDLLVFALRILQRQEAVRRRFAERYRWIMVDEYQDTNLAQERLVELISSPLHNVCVVGDDDQSIYRFRGASRANLERFLNLFPACVTRTLGVNRRSAEPVVAAARQLIEHDSERLVKNLGALRTGAKTGDGVFVWRCATAETEARAVAAEIERLVDTGSDPAKIAVLVRTHALADPIVRALLQAGIPVVHWSGRGFYQRAEVRDLICYLRLLNNPRDVLAAARLVQRPPLSLPLEEAWPHLEGGRRQDRDCLRALTAWSPTQPWALTLIDLAGSIAQLGVQDLFFELMNRTAYADGAVAAAPSRIEADLVAAAISRFGELVDEWCEGNVDHSLHRFMEHLELVLTSGVDEERMPVESDRAVQVLSIHQAKGLEFDAVFVPSLVEGRLPQPRRSEDFELPGQLSDPTLRGRQDHLAEERRLLYVAMTRARHRLYLSFAERYLGARKWAPSRFLGEMGEVAIEDVGGDGSAAAESPAAGPAGLGEGARLSFSSISAYRDCPRRYWYRYQLRLPEPATVEAQLGNVVHRALMRAGRLREAHQPVSTARLRSLYESSWAEEDLTDPRRQRALRRLGWEQLRAWREAGGLEGSPAYVEQRFSAEMDGWELHGAIDRVDRGTAGSDEGWTITDFKTGSQIPASRLRRDLQLALYALGARVGLGLIGPLELQIVYLRDSHRVLIEADSELLDNARAVGAEVVQAISRGDFGARPEPRRCRLCAYRMVCPDAL